MYSLLHTKNCKTRVVKRFTSRDKMFEYANDNGYAVVKINGSVFSKPGTNMIASKFENFYLNK